jgi:hypothetical protein
VNALRLRKPTAWPGWLWHTLNTLWTIGLIFAAFGSYAIWHGWPWMWVTITLAATMPLNTYRMARAQRLAKGTR